MDGEKGHLGGRCLTYSSDFLHQAGFLSLIFIGKIAGEGNRTLVCSLGSCRSTIELHPRRNFRFSIADDNRLPERIQIKLVRACRFAIPFDSLRSLRTSFASYEEYCQVDCTLITIQSDL